MGASRWKYLLGESDLRILRFRDDLRLLLGRVSGFIVSTANRRVRVEKISFFICSAGLGSLRFRRFGRGGAEVGRGESGLQGAVEGHGYLTCLFADHDTEGAGHLAHSEGGAVAQSEVLGDVHVVGDREDTPDRGYTSVGDDRRSVVKR